VNPGLWILVHFLGPSNADKFMVAVMQMMEEKHLNQ
jgi:hypothetical protein